MSPTYAAVKFTEPDHYGQRHPIETPELLARSLKEFAKEVQAIPRAQKKCLLEAQRRCPELLTGDFHLMFLRADVFRAKHAAKRYANYWERRVHNFGDNVGYKPLTYENCVTTDMDRRTASLGLINVVLVNGRFVVYLRPWRLRRSEYTMESIERYGWYLTHAGLQANPEFQRKGVVVLWTPESFQLKNYDNKLTTAFVKSLKGIMPVRLSAFHLCNPAPFFRFVWPVVSLALGERLRKRILVHIGDNQSALEKLARYGMPKKDLPTEIGGDYVVPDEPDFALLIQSQSGGTVSERSLATTAASQASARTVGEDSASVVVNAFTPRHGQRTSNEFVRVTVLCSGVVRTM